MVKRTRRSFDRSFKREAAGMVLDHGLTVAEVARDLDLTESSLRNWVKQEEADRGQGQSEALTTSERDELRRLRKENKVLREEREILRKATAFFANPSR